MCCGAAAVAPRLLQRPYALLLSAGGCVAAPPLLRHCSSTQTAAPPALPLLRTLNAMACVSVPRAVPRCLDCDGLRERLSIDGLYIYIMTFSSYPPTSFAGARPPLLLLPHRCLVARPSRGLCRGPGAAVAPADAARLRCSPRRGWRNRTALERSIPQLQRVRVGPAVRRGAASRSAPPNFEWQASPRGGAGSGPGRASGLDGRGRRCASAEPELDSGSRDRDEAAVTAAWCAWAAPGNSRWQRLQC